ncbi:MAG: response regulator transcription factor [Gemmatimonadaceae bacterium]|nr:response regulator transcription factor [Gemmatimonadaceae bacterium]
MTERLRILLADDHALVLEGLRALLDAQPDMQVVGAVADGAQAMELLRTHRPDVVVLDLEMGTMSGLACLERIRAEKIPVRVLVLSAYGDGTSMRAALDGGADGYALKTDPPRHTVDAVRQVHLGQIVFPQAAKRWLLGTTTATDPRQLTEREESVLALLAEGTTNAEIARRLRVSENTVKFHLQNLYMKLSVGNRTEAVAVYLRERAPRR